VLPSAPSSLAQPPSTKLIEPQSIMESASVLFMSSLGFENLLVVDLGVKPFAASRRDARQACSCARADRVSSSVS
jgi:hypothetical protein